MGCYLPPRWIGERRRHAPTAQAAWGGMGREAGGVGGGREAAGGVHLPLPRLVCRELEIEFRPSLRRPPARARLLRSSVSAVQRSAALPVVEVVLDGPVGAAQQPRRMRNGHWTRHSAAAWTCTADGGGDSAGALNGRFAASANGAPAAVLGVHVGVGIDERSDHSAIAAFRRPVQRGPAMAVHGGAGVRGWAPRGYRSTQPVPEHKTAGSPRGSTKGSLWVTVNDREYSREDSEWSPSRIPLAHPSNAANLRKSRERRLRAKEAARNYETRQDGREAYDSRNLTS
jgi:hypothetical protein